jgi:hypothetical protein
MPKKRVGVSLRKPSPAPDGVPEAAEPVVVEAFVNGAAAALERAAGELPAARLRELLQRGDDGYRELTLFLPEKLAQELSLHCLEHNLDMNRLVASAVRLHLQGAPAPTVPEPQPRLDAEASNDGLLSLAARALLNELRDWVRTAWATRRRGPARAGTAVAAT